MYYGKNSAEQRYLSIFSFQKKSNKRIIFSCWITFSEYPVQNMTIEVKENIFIYSNNGKLNFLCKNISNIEKVRGNLNTFVFLRNLVYSYLQHFSTSYLFRDAWIILFIISIKYTIRIRIFMFKRIIYGIIIIILLTMVTTKKKQVFLLYKMTIV